jgi:hypothetical protein
LSYYTYYEIRNYPYSGYYWPKAVSSYIHTLTHTRTHVTCTEVCRCKKTSCVSISWKCVVLISRTLQLCARSRGPCPNLQHFAYTHLPACLSLSFPHPVSFHTHPLLPRQLRQYSIWPRAGWSVFDPRQGQRIFLLAPASRLALGLTQPPVQWVPGCPFPGGKARPGRDADHSLPSCVEVQ